MLAASALVVIVLDPPDSSRYAQLTYVVLAFYTIYSGAIFVISIHRGDVIPVHLMHWFDMCWYLQLVYLTGGSESILFNFFFFAILVASFGWGYKSGLAITLASAGLFTMLGILTFELGGPFQLNRLLLRSLELIILGFMIARWGGFRISLRNRLQLLKDVTVLSNAKFGTDRTISSILERLRQFFEADACLLLLKPIDQRSYEYQMYRIKRGVYSNGSAPPQMSAEAARLFLLPSSDHAVVYKHGGHQRPKLINIHTRESSATDSATCERLANALEATSYMSVPVYNHNQPAGRLYVIGGNESCDNSAVDFVLQFVDQVTPLIENIRLIDTLASYAAEEERRRIARDIHDSVIQPYVGLQLGIAAVAQKLHAGNNDVADNVEELLDLTNQELIELRRYVWGLRAGEARLDLLVPAIERFVARFSTVTGINVSVTATGKIEVNDRLAAEIFQMVTEGLSNVRRHALCNDASVELACPRGKFLLQIKNPRPSGNGDHGPTRSSSGNQNLFTPKSIAERASLLGGKTKVSIDDKNRTVVQVAIPL